MNLAVGLKGAGNISDASHKELYKSLLPEVRQYEEYLINRAVDAFKTVKWKEEIRVVWFNFDSDTHGKPEENRIRS